MAARLQTDLLAATYDTPAGRLVVVVDPRAVGDLGPTSYGAVVAATFRDLDDAVERLPADVTVLSRRRVPEVADVLSRYGGGDLHALEEISVLQPGGPFQQQAWIAMRTIRAGSVDTYAGLARRAGSPRAFRAAGTVCSTNLVAPFVPCHRVVASHGIGGYGYGVDVKRQLLAHEGVLL